MKRKPKPLRKKTHMNDRKKKTHAMTANDSSSETAKAGAVAATMERTNDDRTPGEERTQ